MTTRLFLTGGTGLVGRWLIRTLRRDYPNIEIVVLTRTPELNSDLVHSGAFLVRGNVNEFKMPNEPYQYIIHLAVDNTPALLDFCEKNNAVMLYTSSGAVYGRQSKKHVPILETDPCNPDTEYAVKKWRGEMNCLTSGLSVKVARLFTFAGYGQPLEYHYAIGNFISDGLRGGPIMLKRADNIYRSYLHYSEMAKWLLKILFDGKPLHPYNVGSDQAITITELAQEVAKYFKTGIFTLPPMDNQNEWYIPSVKRARDELGLVQKLYYPEVLYKMIEEVR